nr:hypothetical protein [Muribaculaceae bacterium]
LPTTRNIEVKLSHIRNCFVLDPKVKWRLANGETIHYHPRNYEIAVTYDTINPQLNIIIDTEFANSDTGFDDFYIYLGDYNTPQYLKYYACVDSTRVDITYHAKDGSYRYILGDDDEYTFNWEYTYRDGKTYGGVHTIRPNHTRSTRFFHEETIDMGYFMDDKVKVGDFFCNKDDVGYPLPYDAMDLLDPYTCVGVVFYSGHYSHPSLSDQSDYPEKIWKGTSTEATKKCHGYVMALTDARLDSVQWNKARGNNPIIGNDVVTGGEGYQGYRYMVKIKNEVLEKYNATLEDFPAFNACDLYGTTDWHSPLASPDKNTTGWYLPTITQLQDIRANLTYPKKYSFQEHESIMKTLVTLRCKLPQDCAYLNYLLPSKQTGWWSCSQTNPRCARFVDLSNGTDNSTTGVWVTNYHRVRAALSY